VLAPQGGSLQLRAPGAGPEAPVAALLQARPLAAPLWLARSRSRARCTPADAPPPRQTEQGRLYVSAPHDAAPGSARLNGAAVPPGAMRQRVREGDAFEAAGVSYAVKRAPRAAAVDGAELVPPRLPRKAPVAVDGAELLFARTPASSHVNAPPRSGAELLFVGADASAELLDPAPAPPGPSSHVNRPPRLGAELLFAAEAGPRAHGSATAGDPLGRRELGRGVADWLEAGAAKAAARFVDLHAAASGSGSSAAGFFNAADAAKAAEEFSVPDAMRTALRQVNRPAVGPEGPEATLAAATRATAHLPTLWDQFQRAAGDELRRRAAQSRGANGPGGDAGSVAVHWRDAPAWAALKALAKAPEHKAGARRPAAAVRAALSSEAVAAAALSARVAAFCDEAEAQLDLERDAELAIFQAEVLASAPKAGPKAADEAAMLGLDAAQLGDAAGARVLRSLVLVASMPAGAGRRTLTLRAASNKVLPPVALAPGDAVTLSIEGSTAGARGVEGRLVSLGRGSISVSIGTAPMLPATAADPSAALAGKRLMVAAAPDGVTFARQRAALAALRAVPTSRAKPACAAIVAALFPDPATLQRAAPSIDPALSATDAEAFPAPAPPPAPKRSANALEALMDLAPLPAAAAAPASFAGQYAALIASQPNNLDDSQVAAAAAALAKDHPVVCVQGPPGTGKTALIVAVVARAAARGERVLCAAPSNAAVDALASRLAAAGLRCVRVGDSSRGTGGAAVARMGLDAQVAAALGPAMEAELGAVRAELASAAARAAAARDGGAQRAARAALAKLGRSGRAAQRAAARDVLLRAQVVLCTTAGAGDAALADAPDFDLAVLDEAGQATRPSAWLPLLRARRALLVGDQMQLAPTVLSPAAKDRGLAYSALEDAQAVGAPLPPTAVVGPPAEGAAPVLRAALRTQYRSHASIAGWASRESYGGALRTAPRVAARTLAQLPGVADCALTRTPLLLLTTRAPGGALLPACGELGAATSLVNEGEADAVVRHVASLIAAGVQPSRIAVLSPYSAQVALLRNALDALRPEGAVGVDADAPAAEESKEQRWVEVASVDAFQGREADAVVISCVRANDRGAVGFLADARRMNVAVTRARCHVALVADAATVGAHPFLRRLLIHVTDAGGGAVCVRDAAAGTAPWSEELRAVAETRRAEEAAAAAAPPKPRAKPRQPALA